MNSAATGHGKGPKSTPVVSQGSVYTLGITGVLSAHNAATGELKWRRDFEGYFPSTSPLYGTSMSPLLAGGLLIAHLGGQDKGALRAFDPETGAVKWSNNTDGPAYASPIVTTLAGARQLITFMQKDVVGIEVTSGRMLWRLPAKTEYDTNSVTPVVYKDMIVLAREGQGLSAFRLIKKGADLMPEEVWGNKEAELYLSTPVVIGDQLIGLSIRNKGQFFSLDAETGKVIWQSPGRMGENAALVNLNDQVLLLLTNDANLIIQPATAKAFTPLAHYTVAPSPTWAHPVVTGNRILIKDETTLRSLAF